MAHLNLWHQPIVFDQVFCTLLRGFIYPMHKKLNFECIFASVFVDVQKWIFRLLLSLQYLNLAGTNLIWTRTNL
jgi:hypothetical protein